MREEMARPANALPDINDEVPRAMLAALVEVPVDVLAMSKTLEALDRSMQVVKLKQYVG